jgi:hypothetical protein
MLYVLPEMAIPVFAKQRDESQGSSLKRQRFDLYSGGMRL